MKRNLSRLLRVRALREDLSRLDFEIAAAEANAIEAVIQRQQQMARQARSDALDALLAEQQPAPGAWLTSLSDSEILLWKRARTRPLAVAAATAAEQAREELITCRTERRQLETVLATLAALEEKQRIRREQNLIDDWFQSRTSHTRRHSP